LAQADVPLQSERQNVKLGLGRGAATHGVRQIDEQVGVLVSHPSRQFGQSVPHRLRRAEKHQRLWRSGWPHLAQPAEQAKPKKGVVSV